MVDEATTSKRPKTSRPLPAANHKAAGFAAFRANLSRPRGITRSTKKPSIPNTLPKLVRTDTQLNNQSYHVIDSSSIPVSAPRGVKRKLDNMEIVETHEVNSADSIRVSNSKHLRNTEIPNRVSDLVRIALVKSVEGEKQRLRLETSLRQQIQSLEGRLQQEKFDHSSSKQRIRDLERALKAAAANVERTNTLIQATSVQLLEDEGRHERV